MRCGGGGYRMENALSLEYRYHWNRAGFVMAGKKETLLLELHIVFGPLIPLATRWQYHPGEKRAYSNCFR